MPLCLRRARPEWGQEPRVPGQDGGKGPRKEGAILLVLLEHSLPPPAPPQPPRNPSGTAWGSQLRTRQTPKHHQRPQPGLTQHHRGPRPPARPGLWDSKERDSVPHKVSGSEETLRVQPGLPRGGWTDTVLGAHEGGRGGGGGETEGERGRSSRRGRGCRMRGPGRDRPRRHQPSEAVPRAAGEQSLQLPGARRCPRCPSPPLLGSPPRPAITL